MNKSTDKENPGCFEDNEKSKPIKALTFYEYDDGTGRQEIKEALAVGPLLLAVSDINDELRNIVKYGGCKEHSIEFTDIEENTVQKVRELISEILSERGIDLDNLLL